MLLALFRRHASHPHGLDESLDGVGTLLQKLEISSELIAIIRSHRESQSDDQVVDATLEGQDFLNHFCVGSLKAVEFGFFWALELVFYKFLE